MVVDMVKQEIQEVLVVEVVEMVHLLPVVLRHLVPAVIQVVLLELVQVLLGQVEAVDREELAASQLLLDQELNYQGLAVQELQTLFLE